MRKIIVQNEQWQPVAGVKVNMIGVRSGAIAASAFTDATGVASFTPPSQDQPYRFQVDATRRSGRVGDRSISGALHITEF